MKWLNRIVRRLSATFTADGTFLALALFTRQPFLICTISAVVVFVGIWAWKKSIRTNYKPKHPKLRIVLIASLTLAVCAYCISYIPLSLRGEYEPGGYGFSGVHWYEWAPEGFAKDFVWNRPLIFAYWPLLKLDRRFWHHSELAKRSLKYPVNHVSPEEIGRVFRARRSLK